MWISPALVRDRDVDVSRRRGVRDRHVLDAMPVFPREASLSPVREFAYEDVPLPSAKASDSQPYRRADDRGGRG